MVMRFIRLESGAGQPNYNPEITIFIILKGCSSITMEAKRLFFAVSLIVTFLMYAVPYLVLNGRAGAYTLVFWAGLSAAYLAFVFLLTRR